MDNGDDGNGGRFGLIGEYALGVMASDEDDNRAQDQYQQHHSHGKERLPRGRRGQLGRRRDRRCVVFALRPCSLRLEYLSSFIIVLRIHKSN
jgi:hypothetical protein